LPKSGRGLNSLKIKSKGGGVSIFKASEREDQTFSLSSIAPISNPSPESLLKKLKI
jgi:hypothetical protein